MARKRTGEKPATANETASPPVASSVERNERITGPSLAGLDALRFLLAIVIVIYHFPHFDNIHFSAADMAVDLRYAGERDAVMMMQLPFKESLAFVYKYGDFAVRIFWMISGIVFAAFYWKPLSAQQLSVGEFLFRRFSRLYPLHLMTLVLMAALQNVYRSNFGDWFIYPNNDVLRFLLHLFMMNYWNPRFGFSFNGPFWSVSVEVFVYVAFALLAYANLLAKEKWLWILTAVFFAFFFLGVLSPFSEALLYFFAGALLLSVMQSGRYKVFALAALVLSGTATAGYWLNATRVSDTVSLTRNGAQLAFSGVVCIAFILPLRNVGKSTRQFLRGIGNATYAVYMMHIPLQLILILLLYKNGKDFFLNGGFFFGYILLCCLAGVAVFRWVERPAQNRLRAWFSRRQTRLSVVSGKH